MNEEEIKKVEKYINNRITNIIPYNLNEYDLFLNDLKFNIYEDDRCIFYIYDKIENKTFKDILVIIGHESIIFFDYKTKEFKEEYYR